MICFCCQPAVTTPCYHVRAAAPNRFMLHPPGKGCMLCSGKGPQVVPRHAQPAACAHAVQSMPMTQVVEVPPLSAEANAILDDLCNNFTVETALKARAALTAVCTCVYSPPVCLCLPCARPCACPLCRACFSVWCLYVGTSFANTCPSLSLHSVCFAMLKCSLPTLHLLF